MVFALINLNFLTVLTYSSGKKIEKHKKVTLVFLPIPIEVKRFWYIFICSSLSYVCPHLILEAVWVYGGNYNPPVPFIGYICGVFGYLGSCISLYTVFPLSWHENGKMKKLM